MADLKLEKYEERNERERRRKSVRETENIWKETEGQFYILTQK